MAQAFLTVDGTLNDSVIEYASVLDLHNQGLNFVEKTESFEEVEEDDDEIVYSEQLFVEIAKSFEYFSSVPDKEFESVANLAVYVLSYSNEFDSQVITFLTNLIKEFGFDGKVVKNKKTTFKVVSIISVLSNVFNLDVSKETRAIIFNSILDLVVILNNSDVLLPITSNNKLISELDNETLIKFAKTIQSVDESKSLKLYEVAIKNHPSTELIEDYLAFKLNSFHSIDLSIANIEIPSTYSELINSYQTSKPAEFQSTLQKYSSLASLDFQKISKKNQYLTLVKLALSSNKIPFTQLSEELNIPTTEIELFLIDAIKLKLINAKINQIDETLSITKVNLITKEIQLDDWLDIKSNLLDWKTKLREVKLLVEQAQKKKVTAK